MIASDIRHGITSRSKNDNKIDSLSFVLRGDNINPLIDAATPLLGMILRIQSLSTSINEPELLYRQIVTDIQVIEQQLVNQGYDSTFTVTFRYILCTFIDECIMTSDSSLSHHWSKKSLLVHFHNEGWGGEKVFQILERLMSEPKHYKEMLEFFYLCLCLGFRGRYKIQNQNQDEFDRLLRRLNTLLQTLAQEAKPIVLHKGETKTQTYQHIKRLSLKHIVIGSLGLLLAGYIIYSIVLNTQSYKILEQLNLLLK